MEHKELMSKKKEAEAAIMVIINKFQQETRVAADHIKSRLIPEHNCVHEVELKLVDYLQEPYDSYMDEPVCFENGIRLLGEKVKAVWAESRKL